MKRINNNNGYSHAALLLFALVVVTYCPTKSYGRLQRLQPIKQGLLTVDEFRKHFLRLESQLWYEFDGNYNNQIISDADTKPQSLELALIRRFQEFDANVTEEFPHDLTHGLETLQGSWLWNRAYGELRAIYAMYETFRRFQGQQTAPGRVTSPKRAWIDLAETILNDSRVSVPESLNKLNEIVIYQRLYRNALKEIDGGVQCSLKESPQQMLLNLYNTIALTELKGYAMIQFSYMLLKLYGQGNFTKEADIMKERYLMRSSQSIEATKDALKLASRELWICDPKKFVKDKNYLEVTELLQGYVQNEVDLNSDGTCRENCAEYKYTKSHGCFQNLYCHQQRRCYGKIMNCQFIDADAWICPAASGSNRRYEYIEYENGRVLGRKKACHRGTTKVDSWWRWLFWHCSYCVCICDEQGTNSDRYFNLQESLSDIENNKVVTGLRFTKDNRIIHLQVQQGRLLTKGKIEKDSTEWVPVNSYKITDVGIKNEQHYHTLTWEKRAFDLDDLSGDSGELLTGVRFKLIGSHLNFEIRLTPFDFVTGQLLPEKSYWKDNINTDASRFNPRKKLNLENRDIPINTQSPSVPDSQNDQYFEFTHTDLERDVAQTTVPFIDSQNVASTVPVPLSGAGIYHKGLPSFGGFIAPKIFTYNFGEVLENALNDIEMNPDVAVNK